MRVFLTLARREVSSHFLSWTGYVIIAAVLFLVGVSFANLLTNLNAEATPAPVTELFYQTYYFWLILLLVCPIITMRSFAQEKATGTFETLMTAPVGEGQVVLAKFAGALVFYLLMWLPLLPCLFIVRHYSNDPTLLDAGVLGATYFGIFLLGGLYLSLGCFASALTRSQIIAAMVSFAVGISMFLLSFVSMGATAGASWQARALAYLGLTEHMSDFARGVVDTRPVALYLSLTGLFLFLTWRVVESRRWK
jgi:ABC-2 type transport system permease protein